MGDQRRHVELLQVFGEVRLGELLDTVEHALDSRLHALKPEQIPHTLGNLRPFPVISVERQGQVHEELRPVVEGAGADAVEYFDWQTARIGIRFEHQRRDRAQQHSLGDPPRAVPADIARYFPAARGMTDKDDVLQIQRFDELGEIVGVGVHVVTVPCLAGTAVAAPVMGYDAVPALAQEDHLRRPRHRRSAASHGRRPPAAPIPNPCNRSQCRPSS